MAETLARVVALAGGAVLLALVVMTCVSVLGRMIQGALHSDIAGAALPGLAAWLLGTGIGPVRGDYELVEAGIAFAIFAFLPLCQVRRAHASVDILTRHLPAGADRLRRALTDWVFAGVLLLIAVQLAAGMIGKMQSGQTTLLIGFPVWWGYAACLTGAVAAALVGLCVALRRPPG